jgi:hypothetical protein
MSDRHKDALGGQSETADQESERQTWPVVTKLPICLCAVSAITYLLLSEGIRNYCLFLQHAMLQIAEHL